MICGLWVYAEFSVVYCIRKFVAREGCGLLGSRGVSTCLRVL